MSCEHDLRQQLVSNVGCGLVIETWSRLPQGSGLGTSSILASCIIGALWRATGRTFTDCDLIHATLYVEQIITTGGGWQDQVGGVSGGVNIGSCQKSEKILAVDVKKVEISKHFSQHLFSRMVLVYTGTARLAKVSC